MSKWPFCVSIKHVISEREGNFMKKVKIAHRDMSISKISEKILKISEE